MHPYTIGGSKTRIRLYVVVTIVAISIVLSIMINIGVDKLNDCFPAVFEGINNIFNQWSFFGFSFGYISMFVVFNIIYGLFDKYLWKINLINRIHGIPDFTGVWEGELYSSYNTTQTFYVKMIIKQTWSEIQIVSEFADSRSGSDTAFIDPDSNQGLMLKFTYANTSHDPSVGQSEHRGQNELYIVGNRNTNNIYETMEGTYFNNRGQSGNKGNMKIKRV